MAKTKIPQTSLDAYHSLEPDKINDIHQKILNALSALGEGTFEDIAKQLKLPRERIWKRLPELNKMDLIYRPGNKKVLKSGRDGYVWKLTETGKPKVIITEKTMNGQSVSDYSKKLIKTQPPSTNTLF